ncbi:hypothetical protein L1987_22429 [Smallanthus sonchifolius]|uniref:Uncharacterized protein n=1 Tax=Smallanthus sonchifolius TaxID=185202 RepID=A0ACB9IFE5_9ASTR|nr:hypothetical protein L1987_22429 [Smallanthus sonchifolius]
MLCINSYSTLPLYALVTQMGSNFKKLIFGEHIQAGLISWAKKAKKKKGLNATTNSSGLDVSGGGPCGGVELQGIHNIILHQYLSFQHTVFCGPYLQIYAPSGNRRYVTSTVDS